MQLNDPFQGTQPAAPRMATPFTPRVQSSQEMPPPYYGFEPPPAIPSISTYNPTLGTQMADTAIRTLTGDFPGSLAIPQVGGVFPHYSKLEQALVAKMPKQAPAAQVRGIIAKGGVKAEEVEYSGVEPFLQQSPHADREQLLAHIKQTRPQLETSQLSAKNYEIVPSVDEPGMFDVRDIRTGNTRFTGTDRNAIEYVKEDKELGRSGMPKFSQYSLPGGEGYREILVKLPYEKKGIGEVREGEKLMETLDRERAANPVFSSGHFDEPNVLAHLRVNDRVTPDGKKVLFVEEVQSDWHQKGRQLGYAPKDTRAAKNFEVFDTKTGQRQAVVETKREAQQLLEQHPDWDYENIGDSIKQGAMVPDAPYKKSWPMLAMKQALAEAAKDGKDYVAWTTGAQQAERYDLSKSLDYVRAQRASDGTYRIAGGKGGQELLGKEGITEQDLPNVVGKELAAKITKAGGGEFRGLDLKVGGEGMTSFYDKELVNEMNKYAKQWGVKVEQLEMPFAKSEEGQLQVMTIHDYWVKSGKKALGFAPPEKPNSYIGVRVWKDGGMNATGPDSFPTREAAERWAAPFIKEESNVGQVHALPITPRMREEILGKGQPLFSLGAGIAGGALADKLTNRQQTPDMQAYQDSLNLLQPYATQDTQ